MEPLGRKNEAAENEAIANCPASRIPAKQAEIKTAQRIEKHRNSTVNGFLAGNRLDPRAARPDIV
jgi:hypothetical protein